MEKILVYVDAENISRNVIEESLTAIRETKGNRAVIGKFYGSKDILGPTIQFCLHQGFEYVETSSLSANKKNLADMKLLVDCMDDVLRTYVGDVSAVHILSRDSDFLPLIYKLAANGVEVNTLVVNQETQAEYTLGTLVTKLHDVGYLPISEDRVWGAPYLDIMHLVSDEIDGSLVESYVSKRVKKLVQALGKVAEAEKTTALSQLDCRDFSFSKVVATLGAACKDELVDLANIYTTKMFGITIKERELLEYLDASFSEMSICK